MEIQFIIIQVMDQHLAMGMIYASMTNQIQIAMLVLEITSKIQIIHTIQNRHGKNLPEPHKITTSKLLNTKYIK